MESLRLIKLFLKVFALILSVQFSQSQVTKNFTQDRKNRVGLSVHSRTLHSSQGNINLSGEGTTDWVYWGAQNENTVNRKPDANLISDYEALGTSLTKKQILPSISYSWTYINESKKPHSKISKAGIARSGEKNGFRILVPANKNNRLLKLYVGCHKAVSIVTVRGDGIGTWSDTDKNWFHNNNDSVIRCYYINFTASDDDSDIVIEYKILYAMSPDAYITLHAATLQTFAINQPPIVEITSPMSGQQFNKPAIITYEAKAGDKDGSIYKVVYYGGSAAVKLGESYNEPFTIKVEKNNASVSSVTARAFDDKGQAIDSDPVWYKIVSQDSFSPVTPPLKQMFISDHIPTSGHEGIPCLTELANGDLLCVFNAGRYENASDQIIYSSWLKNGAGEWTKPVPSFDAEGMKYSNAVLYTDTIGTVFLFYTVFYGEIPEFSRVRMRKSFDNGSTWGPYVELQQPDYGYQTGTIAAIKPIRLLNGNIILPLNRESYDPSGDKQWFSLFAYTSDHGNTWKETAPIYSNPGNIQPTVQQLPDNSLLAYFRPRGKNHEIWKSVSKDNGKTWTPLENGGLLNPSSRSDFISTKKGNLVIACNESGTTRSPFVLALSKDMGKTWLYKKNIESGYGLYGYSTIIQTRDGKIHVAYDVDRYKVKHVMVDEKWFEE